MELPDSSSIAEVGQQERTIGYQRDPVRPQFDARVARQPGLLRSVWRDSRDATPPVRYIDAVVIVDHHAFRSVELSAERLQRAGRDVHFTAPSGRSADQ